MGRAIASLADRYIMGEFEALPAKEGANRIGQLEESNPDFSTLIRMLRSDVPSAQSAALYTLYNRAGPFPRELVDLLTRISSAEDEELRRWAAACLD